MEYSIAQIREFANKRIQKLMNDEYSVDVLPNSAVLYHQDKEIRDSQAIRNADPNSRLLLVTFED